MKMTRMVIFLLVLTLPLVTGPSRPSLRPSKNQRPSRPSRAPSRPSRVPSQPSRLPSRPSRVPSWRPTNPFNPNQKNRTTRQRVTRRLVSQPTPTPASSVILINISNVVLGYIVSVLNMIEILLLKKLPRKLKIYELLIFSMSISDFSFGFSSSTLLIMYFAHPPWRQWTSLTSLWHTMYFFFIVSSILHLLIIAGDRLFAVIKPVQHNILISRKCIIRILLILWSISFIISASLYISNSFSRVFQKEEIEYEAENITFTNTTVVPRNEITQSMIFIKHNKSNVFNSTSYIKETFTQHDVKQQDKNLSHSSDLLVQKINPSADPIQQSKGEQTTNPIRKLRKIMNRKPISMLTSTMHPTRTPKSQPPHKAPPKIKNIRFIDMFEQKMKEWLSFIIIFADVALVTIYSILMFAIIQHHRNNKHLNAAKDGNLKRVLLICILIAMAFVFFTLPYAILNLSLTKHPLWASLFLVTNSGINSVVFFVRGEYR
uniref:G-protein coupled receptors family 1 profile domain-containing protein n=1 Tax=Clytia hemisphaerica TaxID=252671 RepID=A0A7M5VH41_9CNID